MGGRSDSRWSSACLWRPTPSTSSSLCGRRGAGGRKRSKLITSSISAKKMLRVPDIDAHVPFYTFLFRVRTYNLHLGAHYKEGTRCNRCPHSNAPLYNHDPVIDTSSLRQTKNQQTSYMMTSCRSPASSEYSHRAPPPPSPSPAASLSAWPSG